MLISRRAYFFGAGGAYVSSAISLFSGIVSLWLLAQILSTDDFGHYVVAMSVVVLMGSLSGLGLERCMVLRIAEMRTEQGQLLGCGMMLRIAALVLIFSALVAGGLVVNFMSTDASESAGRWIIWMILIVPTTALGLVLTGWFKANHRVGISELMQGVVDGGRCLFLIGIFFYGLSAPWVATAAVFATFLPLFVLTIAAWGNSHYCPKTFRFADVKSGLQFLLIRLSRMGLNQFGIIAVGIWATGLEAAQFAIAARIASLAAVGQLAFVSTYVTRLRAHLAHKNHKAIASEFAASRVLTYLITFFAVFVCYVFGTAALGAFGNFAGGYAALLILMAGQIGFVAFGLSIEHLSMTESLRVAVCIRVFCTVLFVVLLVFLVPAFADIGAALAFLIANLTLSIASAIAMRHGDGPKAFSLLYVASAFGAVIALVTAALVPQLWLICLLLLIAIGAITALAESRNLIKILT